jgi:hypothetical protein
MLRSRQQGADGDERLSHARPWSHGQGVARHEGRPTGPPPPEVQEVWRLPSRVVRGLRVVRLTAVCLMPVCGRRINNDRADRGVTTSPACIAASIRSDGCKHVVLADDPLPVAGRCASVAPAGWKVDSPRFGLAGGRLAESRFESLDRVGRCLVRIGTSKAGRSPSKAE